MRAIIFVACILGISLIGCDLAEPQPRENPATPPEALAAVNPEPVAPAAPAPIPAEPTNERVEIQQGFTGKGQYGPSGVMDVITVPISQHFSARERTMLMSLEHAEKLYKAANDDKLPNTHDEYMEKIITDNMIKLYDLPPGERYVFDPAQGKLMIEKAK